MNHGMWPKRGHINQQTYASSGLSGKPLPTARWLHQTIYHLIILVILLISYTPTKPTIMIQLPIEISIFELLICTSYLLHCISTQMSCTNFKFSMYKCGLVPPPRTILFPVSWVSVNGITIHPFNQKPETLTFGQVTLFNQAPSTVNPTIQILF